MKEDTKRRIGIFGIGAVIGTFLSILLFQFAGDREEGAREVENLDVVLTTCAIEPGMTLEEECVEIRTVASQFVPPEALLRKELSWHLGLELDTALEPGNVVRRPDFANPPGEKP